MKPIPRPDWTPLPHAGCVGVESKVLPRFERFSLAMLRFPSGGTIHEHPAGFDIDVICLEGSGFTSVAGEAAEIHAGERVRWPAEQPHRLWTTGSPMVTLMVEHTGWRG